MKINIVTMLDTGLNIRTDLETTNRNWDLRKYETYKKLMNQRKKV